MDWLRSEDLKEEKNVTAPAIIIAVSGSCFSLVVTSGCEGVALSMLRISPECIEPDFSDRSAQADVLLREEPDEEEDEEEDEGDRKEDDEDGDTDDGYSE